MVAPEIGLLPSVTVPFRLPVGRAVQDGKRKEPMRVL
jgi:hypothetical protein